MTMLLDGRLRDLATQTHLLETKVSSLGWMAGAGAQTLKSMEEMPRVESHDPACMAIPRVESALRKRSATNGEEIEE